jgi:hypothetical protein
MSWREQLRPGSFRGVSFLIETGDLDAGRRTARHEYPLRDLPYLEDLGRKAREFSMEAFVLGADYMAGRDRLLDACEQAGPGTLVHPYRGELQVVCTGCRVRESTAEGGMARFSLTFVEAGETRYPTATFDTASRVDASADTATAAGAVDLAKRLDVSGPGWISEASADQVGGLSGFLSQLAGQAPASAEAPSWRTISGGMTSGLNSISAPLSTAEDVLDGYGSLRSLLPPTRSGLQGSASLLPGEAGDLVRSGGRLAGRIGGLYRGLGLLSRPISTWTPPARALDPLIAASSYNETLATVPLATASRRRQAANQEAIADFVRRGGVIEAARASSTFEYASADDAVATRDTVVAALETEMERASDDGVYRSLADLRTSVVKDLGTRGADLARLTTWRPPASVPALVAAHRLYGDASRDAEIVGRNRIRHPGRVPGGVPLEVLYA